MFRPIRRKKNELTLEQAKELLKRARRGVLAVNGDDGYPYAIPLNYIYNDKDNKIYFHGAGMGHKFDSIKACDKVCFTVYGNESIKDLDWAPYVQSVVLFGRCHLIEDRGFGIKMLKSMSMKYYPEEALVDEQIQKYGDIVQMFEIKIEHISAKEVQEK